MVLVADNDPVRQEGAAVVRAMLAEGYGLPVTLLPVAQPGLCAVRNAIAAAALDDPAMRFVALIDDHEWPQPGWLDALLICQETGRASCRERVGRYVSISVVRVSLKKKHTKNTR